MSWCDALKTVVGLLSPSQADGTAQDRDRFIQGRGFLLLPYLRVLESPSQESGPMLLLMQGASCRGS